MMLSVWKLLDGCQLNNKHWTFLRLNKNKFINGNTCICFEFLTFLHWNIKPFTSSFLAFNDIQIIWSIDIHQHHCCYKMGNVGTFCFLWSVIWNTLICFPNQIVEQSPHGQTELNILALFVYSCLVWIWIWHEIMN